MRASGVLCDRRLSARLKGKIYKSVVRPAMLYGMETVVVAERMEKKMEPAELKMVRWALGVTLKDRVRNKYISGTAKIRRIGGEAERRETKMAWVCEEKGRKLLRQKSNGI